MLLLKYMRIKKLLTGHWLLFAALILAAILRLWHLGTVPPSLTPDEASLGYNAYSILKTGRDEYGKFLPIVFKSFGDYKHGLYVYLSVPFIASLGLNEFAVRLPSAIAGVISVWLLYLIVGLLFPRNKSLAIISEFVMVANPWSIYFSRGAWEANLSLTLTLAGILLFLKSLKKNKYLILSAIFFALTILSYQGAKLATFVVVFLLGLIYWKDFFKISKKYIFSSIFVGLVIASPIIVSTFTGGAGRLRVFSIFSYPRTEEKVQTFLNQGGESTLSPSYYLFHSETLNFARAILGRWFNHFSVRFLFFEGDYSNPRHSAPYQGMLLLSDIILAIVGFYALAKKGLTKETAFIFLWLILSPLPAILSRNEVHAVRALNMAIPILIVLSFGLERILNLKYLRIVFGGLFILSFIYFLDAYFIHLPKHNSQLWAYGNKQVVQAVTPIQKNYQTIKVEQSYDQPFIYFLFYQQYDPARYQKQARISLSENIYDVGLVTALDNIKFVDINWPVDSQEQGTLIVAAPDKIPAETLSDQKKFRLIKDIKYLNNIDTAFRILEVK